MSVTDAIAQRRSIKKFTDRAITREEIERFSMPARSAACHE
jgi:nitroreductase